MYSGLPSTRMETELGRTPSSLSEWSSWDSFSIFFLNSTITLPWHDNFSSKTYPSHLFSHSAFGTNFLIIEHYKSFAQHYLWLSCLKVSVHIKIVLLVKSTFRLNCYVPAPPLENKFSYSCKLLDILLSLQIGSEFVPCVPTSWIYNCVPGITQRMII